MVLQAFRASMVLQSSAYSLNMSLILFHAEPLMRAELPPYYQLAYSLKMQQKW